MNNKRKIVQWNRKPKQVEKETPRLLLETSRSSLTLTTAMTVYENVVCCVKRPA